mmetsp:Transcript_18067/g.55311  ORF Transcript_18067/g.55311 Transcript_18067/m.55311 type:complete len:92 (+) Transcript_18067:206-481(+)
MVILDMPFDIDSIFRVAIRKRRRALLKDTAHTQQEYYCCEKRTYTNAKGEEKRHADTCMRHPKRTRSCKSTMNFENILTQYTELMRNYDFT